MGSRHSLQLSHCRGYPSRTSLSAWPTLGTVLIFFFYLDTFQNFPAQCPFPAKMRVDPWAALPSHQTSVAETTSFCYEELAVVVVFLAFTKYPTFLSSNTRFTLREETGFTPHALFAFGEQHTTSRPKVCCLYLSSRFMRVVANLNPRASLA